MNASIHPPVSDDLFQRQVELEIEMAGLGAEKFRGRVEKGIEKERGATQQPGSYLVQKAVIPMAERLKDFIKDAYSGRPRPRAIAAKLTKDMDPYVVAYLSSRAILNRLMKSGSVPLLTLARSVAQQVEAEARFTKFEEEAPGLYKTVSRNLAEDGATDHHKLKVLTYAMNKFDISWDLWSKTERLHLGIKLVELFVEASGFAQMVQAHQSDSRTAPRDQYRIELSSEVHEWIDASIDRGADRWPEYMPTLIPPKDWTGLKGGGYHTNAARPLDLVKACRPEQRKLLDKAHLGAVFGGLNAIQRTPWAINSDVLDVMQAFVRAKSDVAGLVSGRDVPLPDRPHDIDTNAEALQQWKWKARDAHTANVQLRRDRMQQQALLDLAERFRPEAAIYFPHNLDFRGRAYPVPQLLHPQGSDNVKALLRFAEGKPLGEDGERWLAIHGANCFGVDKVSFDKRVAWVEENRTRIYLCARDPLTDLWWTEADSPWCFLAFCFEWQGLMDSLGCWERPASEFISHLPIALDGSCNGLQHFSAMLLDPVGGAAVNLIPADEPQDIYQVVADRVLDQLRLIHPKDETDPGLAEWTKKRRKEVEGVEINRDITPHHVKRWAYEWLQFGIDRKVTKRPVMVLPYGGTARSCLKYVEEAVKDRIGKGQAHNFGDELPDAIAFLSSLVWSSIGNVVVAARDAMDWLQKVARGVSKQNLPLHWTTPSGFVAYQAYMDMKARQLQTKIAGTVVRPREYEETDRINGSKQASSLSPNFVHSMDAAAMMLTVAHMAAEGITSFAMIHDSYGTHACHASRLSEVLREEFIRMYEADPLGHFSVEIIEQADIDMMPDFPKKGDLNLWAIQNSDFFFA